MSLIKQLGLNSDLKFERLVALIVCLCLAFFAAIYFEMFYELMRAYKTGWVFGLITNELNIGVFFRIFALFLVFFFLFSALDNYAKQLPEFLYKYRFLLAVLIIFIGVFFQINGSSLACWGLYLEGVSREAFFGIPRAIRSDEWLVGIPVIFSQSLNDFAPISDIVRGTATNMSLPSYAPNWSLSSLFHPASWGFLLFGLNHGLAFSWIAPKVAVFMISFECAMLYTRKNKALSLAAAFLLSFSPLIVWWNIDCFLFFGQTLVVSLYYFLRARKLPAKILLSALIAYFAGCFLLLLYPAWQVPFFFIFALMGVWVILEYRKDTKLLDTKKTFEPVKDSLMLFGWTIVFAAMIVYVFYSANDALQATTSTVYPVGRVSTGGDIPLRSLIGYPAALFFAIASPDVVFMPNVCEESTMFSLFPIGLLFGCYLVYKKRDTLVVMLILIQIVFLVYSVFGFPEWLARVTLFSYVPAERLLFSMGFIDIVLLLRSMTLLSELTHNIETRPRFLALNKTFFIAVFIALALCLITLMSFREYLTFAQRLLMYMAMILVISEIFFLINTKNHIWQKLFTLSIGVIITVSGLCVNPIQIGSGPVIETRLYYEIEALAKSEDTLWIAESLSGRAMSNYCIAAGAPTINSVNVYPDLERWRLLDPKHEFEDIYNRFAHISVTLQDSHITTFTLQHADHFSVELNWRDLKTLGVTHILSANQSLYSPIIEVSITKVCSANGYSIYEITYK